MTSLPRILSETHEEYTRSLLQSTQELLDRGVDIRPWLLLSEEERAEFDKLETRHVDVE